MESELSQELQTVQTAQNTQEQKGKECICCREKPTEAQKRAGQVVFCGGCLELMCTECARQHITTMDENGQLATCPTCRERLSGELVRHVMGQDFRSRAGSGLNLSGLSGTLGPLALLGDLLLNSQRNHSDNKCRKNVCVNSGITPLDQKALTAIYTDANNAITAMLPAGPPSSAASSSLSSRGILSPLEPQVLSSTNSSATTSTSLDSYVSSNAGPYSATRALARGSPSVSHYKCFLSAVAKIAAERKTSGWALSPLEPQILPSISAADDQLDNQLLSPLAPEQTPQTTDHS